MKDFDQIYGELFKSVYRFVYRLINNSEEAEQITQESFIKLYCFSKDNTPIKEPCAWMYRVATNLCLNELKRKERYQKIIKQNPGLLKGESEQQANTRNSEETFLIKEKQDQIRDAFNDLPSGDQVVLELYQAGLSYPEMASILKVKTSTIGKKLYRARHRLAQKIKQGDLR
jgi:RNA polymerase sigma factor (sigma-70 family)